MEDRLSSSTLLNVLLGTGLMAGGQTQEHIQYNVRTQVLVQVLQAIALVPATVGLAGGLFFVGTGLGALLEQATDLLDVFLLAVGLVLAVGTISRGLGKVADWREWKNSLGREVLLGGLAVVGVFVALSILRLMLLEADFWDWFALSGGLAISLACGLLVWRFGNELRNPLFPKAPTTEVLEKVVDNMTESPSPAPIVVEGPFPVRGNGNVLPMLREQHVPEEVLRAAEEGGSEVVLGESYKLFIDLIALVERATISGWTRDKNVIAPRIKLPSGARLTRTRFDELVEYAASEWGIVDRTSKGVTPEWAVEPEIAVKILTAAWSRTEDGSPPPLSEPWQAGL